MLLSAFFAHFKIFFKQVFSHFLIICRIIFLPCFLNKYILMLFLVWFFFYCMHWPSEQICADVLSLSVGIASETIPSKQTDGPSGSVSCFL